MGVVLDAHLVQLQRSPLLFFDDDKKLNGAQNGEERPPFDMYIEFIKCVTLPADIRGYEGGASPLTNTPNLPFGA